ncbi:hypothetical protein MMC16_000470 [Acarospora aff. strigata]|nr:hypothetical protein [Acarospora aff. strigata]
MTDVGQWIDNAGFRTVSGIFLGIALILACGRIYIKISKYRRLFVDDYLFIAANVFLVAGTILYFLVLPYNQTQVNVAAGIIPPPPDLLQQLDLDVKLQDSASLFINAAVYTVKFSFLFFFRLLLHRTKKLQVWWWCVFIFTIPCMMIAMCTNFMACPAFGDRILEVCVTDAARKRQITVVYTVVVLDIFTDLLLMSIPVLLLWSVRINLRRKIALGSLLCLSVFAIITNIIRAASHKLNNGQEDVLWLLFWSEMEGCIAVIANSMTAYRALFAASSSQIGDSPRHEERSSALRNRYPKRIPGGDLPTMPAPTFTGFKSMIQKDPFADDGEMMDSERMLKGGSGIQVTHSFRTHSSSGDPSERTGRDWHEMQKPSQENFV